MWIGFKSEALIFLKNGRASPRIFEPNSKCLRFGGYDEGGGECRYDLVAHTRRNIVDQPGGRGMGIPGGRRGYHRHRVGSPSADIASQAVGIASVRSSHSLCLAVNASPSLSLRGQWSIRGSLNAPPLPYPCTVGFPEPRRDLNIPRF